MQENKGSSKDEIYSIPDPTYLNFNRSLIEGEHQELPNPYYKHQVIEEKERNDYSHLSDPVIRAIVMEYGPFGELKEEKLQDLIDRNANDYTNADEMDIDKSDEILNQEQKEVEENDETDTSEVEFYKKRDDLLQIVRSTLGSATITLDFVSLLLSAVRPAAGASSMSAHLKQNIKLGSLSCEKIELNIPDPEEHKRKHKLEAMRIGRGWKLQSLKKSKDFVNLSVARMKKNLSDEETYWKEVLDVLKENELIISTSASISVSKSVSANVLKPLSIPKQHKVLAVKYGYGDSGSNYFDNGIAVLKKAKDGHLEFEKLSQNEREKTWGGEKIVSVKLFRISKNPNEVPELIGQSDSYGFLNKEIIFGDNSFVSNIKNSRCFIFENELFWHLMKEAASLISLQIQIIDSTIKIYLFDTCIQLEAIHIDSEELVNPTPELPENKRADDIIKFFRILLCANNYKNIQKLHVPTVALSKDIQVQKTRHSILISPIVMYTKHNYMIKKFKILFLSLLIDNGVDEEMANSIINNELIIKRFVNDPNELKQFKNSKRCYNNDPFLRVYSKMAPTSLMILKHNGKKFWIELVSSYATLHISMNVKVSKIDTKEVLLESTFNSKRDVEQCLSWILKQKM